MIVNTDFTAAQSVQTLSDTFLDNEAAMLQAADTVPEDQRWHPIYGSPAVIRDLGVDENGEVVNQIRIFFGTGDSPYYDENIDTANTTYHFFAYVDKSVKHAADASNIQLDWFYTLPPGNRVFASAFAAAETIYFGTSTAETEDPCEGHGQIEGNQGRIYAFDLKGVQRLNRVVGDIRTSPMVEDEHLYFRTPIGLHSLGSGAYNTPMRSMQLPKIRVRLWKEMD
jgi:outer membrane protein assembly factor BamB